MLNLTSTQWRINHMADNAHASGPQKNPGHFCPAKNTLQLYHFCHYHPNHFHSLSKGFYLNLQLKLLSRQGFYPPSSTPLPRKNWNYLPALQKVSVHCTRTHPPANNYRAKNGKFSVVTS